MRTASGSGKSFVRRPADTGSFTVSADLKKANATFTLRNVVGKETANLVATFVCGGP
jgi:hypothetical protein